MQVLVIGGGGREHVLCWKLSESPLIEKLYCIPGNAGITKVAQCVEGEVENIDFLIDFVRKNSIDLTVVGPEAPLVAGIVDRFREEGMIILGPEKEAALLEGSKVWAKEFMEENSIPTAPFKVFDDFNQAKKYILEYNKPLVVKADGLAAGKGVYVTGSPEEAIEAIEQIMTKKIFNDAGNRVVLEDRLVGEEASLLALTDGNEFWTMPSAQDHKAAGEGDTGPNTGGMGAYSPAPVMTPELIREAEDMVFRPLLDGMKKRGLVFRGIIYAGLMVTSQGLMVLEFNVRFGDPEAQALLPRFAADLATVLKSAAEGHLQGEWRWKEEEAVCVVMASGGYPGPFQKGKLISGLDEIEIKDKVQVFHGGTTFQKGQVITSGGRVLGVTAMDNNLKKAVERAYKSVDNINFEGAYYRNDIAHRALKRIKS